MAYGESGARASRAIFVRVAGAAAGEGLIKLSTATIRAVALGVIGVAFIQAILIGLALLLAGVPAAGVLAVDRARIGHCPSAGPNRHDSSHHLHLVEW